MIADRDLVMRPVRRVAGKRRYHFHAPGLIYVGVTLFLAIGAINSQNNLLFAALGLAIGGLLVSGVLSGSSLLGVRIERHPIVRATAGRPLTLTYTVSNENRFAPAFGLNIVELPAGRGRGAADWAGKFHPPRAFVSHISAKKSIVAESVLVPRRRGRCELRAVRVWSTFPFGLARKSVTFDFAQPFVIQPVMLRLRPELIERMTVRSTVGVTSERNPGMGEEFFGLREYAPGDTPRRIAWRRTARTGDVVVRLHSAPAPVRLWVALRLDGAGGEGSPRAGLCERAIAIAAAVARHGIAEGVAVGLAISSPRVIVPPGTGPRHLDRVLNELGLLDLTTVPRGAAAAPLPAPIARGSAVVVVHAGQLDRAGVPHSAIHLVASELESYLRDDRAGSSELLELDQDSDGNRGGRVSIVQRAAEHIAEFIGLSHGGGA